MICQKIISLSAAFRCFASFRFNPPALATHRAILHVFCCWLRLWQSCHRFLLKRGAISKCVRVSRPFSFFLSFYLHLQSQQFFLFIFSSPFFVCLFVFSPLSVGSSFYFFVCDLFVCCLVVIWVSFDSVVFFPPLIFLSLLLLFSRGFRGSQKSIK